METSLGPKTAELIASVQKNPRSFSFEQIFRLMRHHLAELGDGSERALHDQVRVVPWLSLAFPPADVLSFKADIDDRGQPHYSLVTTNFGLYSTQGPLPTFYTEDLIEEYRADSSLTKDFLDIINSHLYHYYGLSRSHNNQPARLLEYRDPVTEFVLYAFMGQGQEGLRPETGIQAGTLEFFLGPRSSQGLSVYLCAVLSLERIEVEECVRYPVDIPLDQRCRLGRENTFLGDNIVVGLYITDYQTKIRLHFFDVAEETIQGFVRNTKEYERVKRHVDRFVEDSLEFDICLHPAPVVDFAKHRLGLGLSLASYLCAPGSLPQKPVLVRF